MRLISFLQQGMERFGRVSDDTVEILGGDGHALRSVTDLIASGDTEAPTLGTVALAGLRYLPPVVRPGKILCIGTNYEEHRVEMNRERPAKPVTFARFAESQVGHGQPMLAPSESIQLDYEGEIAIVIGKPGRRIAAADALGHVYGYSAYNDGSIRDWQRHTHQFHPGKNFDATGAFGPWLVTADEVGDYRELELTTRLNGQVVQQATGAQMIFSIPQIIEYLSGFCTLRPGDVIVTGTPGGVGARREPPLWMKAGDTVEVEVSGIATLTNPIVADRKE